MGAMTAHRLHGYCADEWKNVQKVPNMHPSLPLPNISHAQLRKKFGPRCPGAFLIFLIEVHFFFFFD